MRTNLNLSLLLTLVVSWTFAQELPEAVTLDEAVTFGQENNRQILNASREVQRAYKERWSTIAIGLPQISASTNYQNFLELPTSLIPAQFFGGKNLLEKTALEIKKNIVSSYSSVLLIQENIKFLEKNKGNLEANLNEVRALFRNGFEEEESVEQLRLTLSSVETQLRYAKNTREISLNMLKLLMGFPTKAPLELVDTLESLTTDGLFEQKFESEINLDNNVDIKIASNNLRSESLLYKYEKSKSLPRLSAFLNGNYTGNSETFSFTDPEQKWFGAALFGVNLQVPIFSSFKRRAQSQKAKIAVDQAETSLEETQERISIEVQAAVNEYELSVETYFTNKENLALAERIEQKNQSKYFEGIASSFDLRQAQLQLYSAQNNYISAIQNVIQKKLTLETLLNTPVE